MFNKYKEEFNKLLKHMFKLWKSNKEILFWSLLKNHRFVRRDRRQRDLIGDNMFNGGLKSTEGK